MKPTTYRAGFQRLVAVGVNSWRAHLAPAGGGLFRPLGGAGFQRFCFGEIARRDLPRRLSLPSEVSLLAEFHTQLACGDHASAAASECVNRVLKGRPGARRWPPNQRMQPTVYRAAF